MVDTIGPTREPLPQDDPHYDLYCGVKEALLVLPDYFRSDIVVNGVLATDIFTLNAPFAAAIEEQTVAALNDLRSIWDKDKQYQAYRFGSPSLANTYHPLSSIPSRMLI